MMPRHSTVSFQLDQVTSQVSPVNLSHIQHYHINCSDQRMQNLTGLFVLSVEKQLTTFGKYVSAV